MEIEFFEVNRIGGIFKKKEKMGASLRTRIR